jgi:tetratricopeptide (TPR) repeat protein
LGTGLQIFGGLCTFVPILLFMRFFTVLLLLAFYVPAATQALPRDYAAQQILLAGIDRNASTLDSLGLLANKEQNSSFARLLALHRAIWNPSQAGTPANFEHLLVRYCDSCRKEGAFTQETLGLVYLSSHYWSQGDHEKSLLCALRAYPRYAGLSSRQFPVKANALYELAKSFFYFHDYQTAARYLHQTLPLRASYDYPGPVVLRNTIGLCHRHLGNYDSALHYFNEARSMITRQSDIWNGILHGNIGITYYMQGRFADAIPLLQDDIRESLAGGAALDNAVHSLMVLGDIYLQQHRMLEAGRVLDQAWTIAQQEHFFEKQQLMAELYRRLATLEEGRGRISESARYWKAALDAQDSVTRQTNALVTKVAELKVISETNQATTDVLSQELRHQVFSRNALLAVIALLGIIGVLMIQRLRARHLHRQQQADADLKIAGAQLEAFTRVLHEKNALLDRIRSEVAGTIILPEHEDPEALSQLRGLTILTEEEWARFRVLFEKVHHNFFARLELKLPGLTPGDIRFVALNKLQFSNKEIGSILGINANSVRVTRSRLRKKLNLAEEDSLEAVIATI